MNKKLVILAIILLLILLGGGYYLLGHRSTSQKTSQTEQPTKTSTVFNSIADALTKSLSLKCDYATATVHTIAYIKNGMVRSDVTDSKNPSLTGSVIIKDKKIYYWNAQKMGFMMAMPEVSVTPSTGTNQPSKSGQNTLQDLEKYKQYCQVATVADSMFSLPTDIKFTDETQMMRSIPSGAMPSGASGTNYQQYMQQYKITPPQQ